MLDADVLFLQETGGQWHLQEIQSAISVEVDSYAYIQQETISGQDRGLGLVSRFAPYFDGLFYLNTENGPSPVRGFQEAHFRIGEDHWVFINVHLKSRYTRNRDDPQGIETRKAALLILTAYIQELSVTYPDAPMVVLGDFNAEPSDLVFCAFVEDTELVQVPLVDKNSQAWTYTYTKDGSQKTLDMILTNTIAYELIENAHIHTFTQFTGIVPSDHRPLSITFLKNTN